METKQITIQQDPFEGQYFYSFDTLRVICILMLTLSAFGLPFRFLNYARPFLTCANGILFTLYGFIVLRDGADLRKNIRHCVKVFIILFAVYGLITMGYLYVLYGRPFMYFNKHGIFNFVVLNFWGEDICSTIWYVQSVMYALIILWLLRRFKDLDWLLCIVLFVFSILIGELASVIGFKFIGNDYIPGNFLTRTIPYMLLGRLLRRNYGRISAGKRIPVLLITVGIVLSVLEFFILLSSGKLGYTGHFIGFILIAAGVCLWAAGSWRGNTVSGFGRYAGKMYKGMYFVYNPLYYVLVVIAGMLCRTIDQVYIFDAFSGLITAAVLFVIFFVYAKLALKIEDAKKDDASDENSSAPAVELSDFENIGERQEKESFEGFENVGEKQESEVFEGFENVGEKQESEVFGGFENVGEKQESEVFEGFENVGERHEKQGSTYDRT